LYAHPYAERSNRERNEKSWELSGRSKIINKPFCKRMVFGEMALFQDKAFFLRLGHFHSKWLFLVQIDESGIFL
jgi:hypothetical protein